VLLADRHHGLTEGVRALLETTVVMVVADETSLIEGVNRFRPDVAIVDLPLARQSGLGWLRAVRCRCPGLEVIMLSVHDEESARRAAKDAGADAFVLTRDIATDLLPAVERVRAGPGAVGLARESSRRESNGQES
jgi:DNA-binding NarL/FixJ family response regulator